MSRILLADDDRSLRSALSLLIETRLGTRLSGEAANMETLLEQMQTIQPEIVILDWDLPGLPAQDRVQSLKNLRPSVKVVVSNTSRGTEMQTSSADAFLCKTDPPEMIISTLQSILSERK